MTNDQRPERLFWLWVPVALYIGFIFWISSRDRPVPGIEIWGQIDKLYHFLEYLPLGSLWIRALRGSVGSRRWGFLSGTALLGSLVVAILDEWHQQFVSGKSMSFWDGAADTAGALLGIQLYLKAARTP